MTLRWFMSRTVRQAHHAARHVRKLVDHQRDLLSPQAIDAVHADIAELRRIAANGSSAEIREGIARLEKTANKWLKPYPNPALRENVEVLLVAIAVAMAIRTFFLQPFKIPTGSMQPTLYGVTEENLIGKTNVAVPGPVEGFFEYWFRGVSYKHVVAKQPGKLEKYSEPSKFILFNLRQQFQVGGVTYTVWFPPDGLLKRAGLLDDNNIPANKTFAAGEDLIKLRIVSGDHLFVDRVSYNFRRPARGDIIVFETHGITRLPVEQQDTYYIKRLCGLGDETLALEGDYNLVGVPRTPGPVPVGHLVVNGRDITPATRGFENLYAFPGAPRRNFRSESLPDIQWRENHYHGHALVYELGAGREMRIPAKHYAVLGDNTMMSFDSRYFGWFPQERVLGKSFFVYWPIGGTKFKGEDRPSRFGWSHQ